MFKGFKKALSSVFRDKPWSWRHHVPP